MNGGLLKWRVLSNYIFVGDPHVVPNELEDSANLMAYTLEKAIEYKATLVLMGDLHHTHSILRVEVIDFWRSYFKLCKDKGVRVISIIGNHDQKSEGASTHALVAYEDLITVVEDFAIIDKMLWISYTSDNDYFVKVCNDHSSLSTVICHATFDGARYESGFPCLNGIKQEDIPQEAIISGHIHTEGYVGNDVHYVGSPRWRSLADANQVKAIWLIDIVDGNVISEEPFYTESVCRKIFQHNDTETVPLTQNLLDTQKSHDLRVDIYGSEAYCDTRQIELKKLGIKTRVFKTRDKVIKVKESDGIDSALIGFMGQYQPKYVDNMDSLKQMVRERLQINV